MAVVLFDPAAFKNEFPEFNAVSDGRLTAFFNQATLAVNNTDCSIVQDINERTIYLNLITAHIADLRGCNTADGRPRPTGKINSATQGSVSVSFGGPSNSPSDEAYWWQTAYGAEFWQLSARYRGARYIPNPTRVR